MLRLLPPQIATKYYLPSLKSKALTKAVHEDVQRAFVTRFGPYAGWLVPRVWCILLRFSCCLAARQLRCIKLPQQPSGLLNAQLSCPVRHHIICAVHLLRTPQGSQRAVHCGAARTPQPHPPGRHRAMRLRDVAATTLKSRPGGILYTAMFDQLSRMIM